MAAPSRFAARGLRRVRRTVPLLLLLLPTAAPFVVVAPLPAVARTVTPSTVRPRSRRWAAVDDTSAAAALPDLSGMSAGDLRRELESYGISTKSFLEKKDLVQALEKARAEGLKPKAAHSSEPEAPKGGGSDGDGDGAKSRADRIQAEMAKASAMKVADLKEELQARGVSTASFFEKSEFVRAYAEAVVDGVAKGAAGAGGGARAKASGGSTAAPDDEPYDPSYRDVVLQKFNGRDPRMLSGVVIDVPLRR